MIKVTFRIRDGVYWAVCESVSRIQEGGFLLDSLQKDSSGGGRIPGPRCRRSMRHNEDILSVPGSAQEKRCSGMAGRNTVQYMFRGGGMPHL